MKEAYLKAVHDDDLQSLLKSLKVYEQIEEGQYNCIFCGSIISTDNLGSIIPFKGEIQFSCNNDSCLQRINEIGGDKDDSK